MALERGVKECDNSQPVGRSVGQSVSQSIRIAGSRYLWDPALAKGNKNSG